MDDAMDCDVFLRFPFCLGSSFTTQVRVFRAPMALSGPQSPLPSTLWPLRLCVWPALLPPPFMAGFP